jgi:hypothetical protein
MFSFIKSVIFCPRAAKILLLRCPLTNAQGSHQLDLVVGVLNHHPAALATVPWPGHRTGRRSPPATGVDGRDLIAFTAVRHKKTARRRLF